MISLQPVVSITMVSSMCVDIGCVSDEMLVRKCVTIASNNIATARRRRMGLINCLSFMGFSHEGSTPHGPF